MKEKVVIIGAGQHCNVVLYNMKEQALFEPACILDINQELWGKYIQDVYIETGYKDFDSEFLDRIRTKYKTNKFFIGLGNMKLRSRIFSFFSDHGWSSVNIIHPNAVVSTDARMGLGNLIECGCLVTPQPIIGNNVVINTGSQVNHDNILKDNVYIASGVILSGGVTINENTLIDDGVIVTLGKTIGKNCIIGAGAVVTKDIPDNVIAFGNPCKVVRDNH